MSADVTLHIVPSIIPPLSAIADYALALAAARGESPTILTPSIQGLPESYQGVPVVSLSEVQESLVREASAVYLHYEGYGYARRGLPYWLLVKLRSLRSPIVFLITIFHEIYASGPWHTSAFWLCPLQKKLASQIAHLSDIVIVTREKNRTVLISEGAEPERILYAPVFSVVGEPPTSFAAVKQERTLAIFGTPGRKSPLYSDELGLQRIVRALGIERIIDIGLASKNIPSQVEGATVEPSGYCSQSRAQFLLASAYYGAIDYPADILGKSSIFASYAAWGVTPIVRTSVVPKNPVDGLSPGEHYLLWSELRSGTCSELISKALGDWYQDHNVKMHGAMISKALERPTSHVRLAQ